MNLRRMILVAVLVAATVEGLVFAVFSFFGEFGAGIPDLTALITICILHAPGLFVVDILKPSEFTATVLLVAVGFLQYFLMIMIVMAIWSHRRKRLT